MPFLRYQLANDDLQLYELPAGETVIGRYPFSDLVLPVQSVSRQHARVLCGPDGCHVEDLNSQNGTFLNGGRLDQKTRLRDQDQIQIYEVQLTFFEAAPAATSPVRQIPRLRADGGELPTATIVESLDTISMRVEEVGAAAKLHAVLELNRSLGSSLDVDEVMPKILDSLFDVFPQADRGFILLASGPNDELELREIKDRWDERGDVATLGPLSLSMAERVMREGQGLLTRDAFDEDMEASVLDVPIRSVICAPLAGPRGKPLGIVHIYTTNAERPFVSEDLEVLVSVATVAGQALEYARQHQATVQTHLQREVEAQRHAEELERYINELEQFAFVASHDMKTPVRAVVSCCELVQKQYAGQLDDEANELIGHAVSSAVHMESLLNGLLEYANVRRSGRSFEPVDFETVFQTAVSKLRKEIEAAGADVSSESLPTVAADRQQMENLLTHLLDNALKFRGSEPPQIRVTAKERDEHWLFTVHDNGIGVSHQYSDRIFVIFQRLHSQQAYPGVGIGLSICKRIVERHGGRIGVTSRPGNGSTFYFTIPIRTQDGESPGGRTR